MYYMTIINLRSNSKFHYINSVYLTYCLKTVDISKKQQWQPKYIQNPILCVASFLEKFKAEMLFLRQEQDTGAHTVQITYIKWFLRIQV